jgi:hypothetical protein
MSRHDAEQILRAFGGQLITPQLYIIQKQAVLEQDYLVAFIWDPKEARIATVAIDTAEGKESQYLRRLCGEHLGVVDWNWKAAPRKQVLELTLGIGFRINRQLTADWSQPHAALRESTGISS